MRTLHTLLAVLAVLAAALPAQAQDPADGGAPAPAPAATPAPAAPPVPAPTPAPKPTVPTPKATPDDAPLLAALLRLERALGEADAAVRTVSAGAAIRELAALRDARAVPALERLSRHEQPALRFSALGALGAFPDDERARKRLEETMTPGAPPDDAAVALPYLLELARKFPGSKAVACPEGWKCVPDEVLLAGLLAYAETAVAQRAEAVTHIGNLDDPRAVPFLWRQSGSNEADVRLAALAALARVAREPVAKARLVAALSHPSNDERAIGVRGLAALEGDDVTGILLAARAAAIDPKLRAQLDEVLGKRAPDKLAALVLEEQRRLAEEANKPGEFDTTMRTALTATAAVGAATGAAAASSLVADELQPGSGACYGAWGACAGGASAAAIGWFGLGDRKLDAAQVSLAISTSAWGAWTGLLVPPTIGPAATKDVRHMIYSAAAGQLVGLALGTGGALISDPSMADIGEMNAIVVAANALTAGFLLSMPPSDDARPLFGALAGATIVSGVGAFLGAPRLQLDEHELGHTALVAGISLVVGASTGLAVETAFLDGHPTRVPGIALAAAGLGTGIGLTLGHLDLAPSNSGMIYEAWAATTGAVLGAGGGLFIDTLYAPATTSTVTVALGGFALGGALGAASTAFFPEGVAQDSGDLMLQPLFVGFGLYHGGALALTAGIDPRLVGATALLTPALASAGLVFAAPYISASTGDVLMVGSMMGIAAYGSSMVLLSATARGVAIPASTWVLSTSLAMDAGIAAGVLLDMSNIDYVGWRTTYVCAVAAGTTLVLSLPGSLLASGSNGAVAVSDVLLGSSILGAAIGFATMPLIDFRIAPDFGLGNRPGEVTPVEVKPGVVAMAPDASGEVPMGLGVTGRF